MSKFESGQLLVTRGISEQMRYDDKFHSFCHDCLVRHLDCDWGDLCDEDVKSNKKALKDGTRLMSVYIYPDDREKTIWIITEADRSSTTVLFPHEY